MALVVFGKFAASSCPSPVDANVKLLGTTLGVMVEVGVNGFDGTGVFVLVGVKVLDGMGVLPGVGVGVGVTVGVQAYKNTRIKTGTIVFFTCASYLANRR
jgi:hypothetical protein